MHPYKCNRDRRPTSRACSENPRFERVCSHDLTHTESMGGLPHVPRLQVVGEILTVPPRGGPGSRGRRPAPRRSRPELAPRSHPPAAGYLAALPGAAPVLRPGGLARHVDGPARRRQDHGGPDGCPPPPEGPPPAPGPLRPDHRGIAG